MDKKEKEFTAAVNRIIGKKCWAVIAGKPTGSITHILIGDKIKREKALKNPHLTYDRRHFDPEYSFMIYCAWRLETEREVICSSTSPNDNDGPMVTGLNRLINKNVVSVDVSLPFYDLRLCFEDSLCLRVFCDETVQDYYYNNYSYFLPEKVFVVGSRSVLSEEEHTRRKK